MKSKDINLTVLCCARNCAPHVEESWFRIKEFQRIFKSVHVFVAENDSKDNTLELLKKNAQGIKHEIFTFDKLEQKIPRRTHRLAHVRNFLHSKVNTEYFVVVDFDSLLKDFDNEGLKNCFEYDPNSWDMLGANCNDRYYDVWTLRTKTFNYDCWDLINHRVQQGYIYEVLLPTIIAKNQIKINKNAGLISVDSCFGGLAIYKTSAFKDCFYDGKPNECECKHLNVIGTCMHEMCEHVALNKQAKKKGAKIFINSNLIVNCQREHLQ